MPDIHRAGIKPWEVGRYTWGELMAAINGQKEREISAAWWQEHMSRQKRLKPLDHYLKVRTKKTVQQAQRDYRELKERLGR